MVVEKYEPFPVGALPGPLASFVANSAKAIGCDPAMIALPTLVAAAAAVGNTRRLRIKSNWQEPGILWGMTVARPGDKKTPAQQSALRSVMELQARLLGRQQERAAFEQDQVVRNEAGEPTCRLENRSVPGHLGRLITTDVTVAGLADLLRDESRGILVVHDELAGWFGDLRKRNGRSDVPRWLSAWTAQPWVLDRHGRDTINIAAAAVSVLGGIQPGVLARTVTSRDLESGLLDRFLYVVPPRSPADCWTDASEDAEDQRMMDIVFSGLYSIADRRDLKLDTEAKQQFQAFYNANGKRMDDADDAMAGMLAKYPRHLARLAMTLQLVRWAVGDAPQDPVDGISMKAAVELANWFIGQAGRALDLMTGVSDDSPNATVIANKEAILSELRKSGTGTVRVLQRKMGKRFQTAEQILDVLRELVQENRVQEVPDTRSGPGRKSPRYRLTR